MTGPDSASADEDFLLALAGLQHLEIVSESSTVPDVAVAAQDVGRSRVGKRRRSSAEEDPREQDSRSTKRSTLIAAPCEAPARKPMPHANPAFFVASFDSDASDSESELEDETRTFVEPVKRKSEEATTNTERTVFNHRRIFNSTKADGRTVKDGEKVTMRDEDGKRKVPPVNNRIKGQAEWDNLDLEADAKAIHDVIPRTVMRKGQVRANQTHGATTILCTVMETETAYRKLVFWNRDGRMPPAMRKVAHARGYHAIQAPAAHAEGEMVEYVHNYKFRTLVIMGCDKPHCAECRVLVTGYLERPYLSHSESSTKVFRTYNMNTPLKEATGRSVRPRDEPGFDPNQR
ncbi:hypothetical protein [Chondromyces crocatus]|uniref:Uncharacterized protein n=1 Tax=Chondromyces crocatus TaxID=52 RepID=A0A0K1E8S6_CHOCO|nr:hypothetical protein [Chondromyces crocatus]AKT36983.1 uncharacterized protein CMC5_011090 [Chondromyces crocatus]